MFFCLLLSFCLVLLLFDKDEKQGNDSIDGNQNNQARCGFENCHGLDIRCGQNIAEICTTDYQLGDKCRQYAKCEVNEGQCGFSLNSDFLDCKKCVEQCESDFSNEIDKIFACESKC